MIVGHNVLMDTADIHVACLDFRPPFSAPGFFQLPAANRKWLWRVEFLDGQGDGIHDDLFIRAVHRRPPHTGESANVLSLHGYPRIDSRDVGPQITLTKHRAHVDEFTTSVRAESGGSKVRRLWLSFRHLASRTPQLPHDTLIVPGVVVPGSVRPARRSSRRAARRRTSKNRRP
jgi:hypothetical protein